MEIKLFKVLNYLIFPVVKIKVLIVFIFPCVYISISIKYSHGQNEWHP